MVMSQIERKKSIRTFSERARTGQNRTLCRECAGEGQERELGLVAFSGRVTFVPSLLGDSILLS